MSKVLLSALYTHFSLSTTAATKNAKNVATDEDPASARLGETFVCILVALGKRQLHQRLKLEQERLGKLEKPRWSWENEMVRFYCFSGALTCWA